MEIYAYPTDALTPVDETEAGDIADRYLPEPARGTGRRIMEFDDGFAVFTVPVPDNGSAPPPRPRPDGGSVHVIDRATGAVSLWPTYPYELVALHYACGRLVIEEQWPDC